MSEEKASSERGQTLEQGVVGAEHVRPQVEGGAALQQYAQGLYFVQK